MKILKFFLIICVLFLIHSCATVPVTGRKQLDLVSSSEINTMSATEYQDVIKKGPLSTNKEQTEMIKRVGSRIQKGGEQYMAVKGWSDQLAGFQWEFKLVLDDKTVDAWGMTGGKVAFYGDGGLRSSQRTNFLEANGRDEQRREATRIFKHAPFG